MKKTGSSNRNVILFVAMGAVFLIALAVVAYNFLQPKEQTALQLAGVCDGKSNCSAVSNFSGGEHSTNPRSSYELDDAVFAELPTMPRDFAEVSLLVYIGRLTDFDRIGSEYWKQPEFYPGFESSYVPILQAPPKDRWGAFGYGTYPSEVLANSPRNATWNISFFVHTSWFVQTYQGIGLSTNFPEQASLVQNNFADGNKTVFQDSAKVREYFDVSVTPQSFLLEPVFPVFKQGWTQKVTVKVRAKNAPPGRYVIGVDIGNPDAEKSNEWLWKYKTLYVGNTGMTGIGRNWFNVFVEVS